MKPPKARRRCVDCGAGISGHAKRCASCSSIKFDARSSVYMKKRRAEAKARKANKVSP